MNDMEQRKQDLLDLGLTEAEISYITSPISKMKQGDIQVGFGILDRRNTLIDTQNVEWRRQRAEAEALAMADDAEELDDAEIDRIIADDGAVKTTRTGDFEVSEPSESLADVR